VGTDARAHGWRRRAGPWTPASARPHAHRLSTPPRSQDTLTGAIKSSGVDLDSAAKTAATAAKAATDGAAAAKPLLEQAATFLTTADPLTLGEYGLGGLALYLLSPALLGSFVGGLRGYAGDLSAVQALEAINSGDAVIIDIRTEARGAPRGRGRRAWGVKEEAGGGGGACVRGVCVCV
jgi:hypothetical protein